MDKPIFKKIFLVVLFILVIFISISALEIKQVNDIKTNHKSFLSNNHFSTDLIGPTDTHEIDNFISMTTLYNEIKSKMESVENKSNSEKELMDLEIVSWINQNIGSNKISIANPTELYMFGNLQSINFENQGGVNTFIFENTIKKVLSLSYALIADIDYSTMKAQKFVPIGTDIYIEQGDVFDSIEIKYEFTGIFDGNGFEIRNLYLADFTYISTTFTDENESTAITVPTIKTYSMFSVIGSNGVIKNFILRNPSYELFVLDDSSGIFQFANLAGENNGLIYNVGVIDERTNTQGEDISGINFTMLQATTKLATAGGYVHTNNGVIKNSYYVAKNVITPTSMFRFSEVAPFVYKNGNGSNINASGFKEGTIAKPVGYNPGEVDSFTEEELKTGSININSQVDDERKWYFYPQDGYPQLFGLDYIDEEYQIKNDYDFIAFSKLINLNTIVNNKSFSEHTYVLVNDINMINFKGYKTPAKEFKGTLKGGDTDFTLGDTNNNNKYIYNLTITEPYISGNKYYLGLFSTLSGVVQNINFYQNEIKILNSSNDYGKTFYIGAVAGELRNGLIKNVINDGNIYLGNEAIGLTYAGGLVGLASGIVTFSANTGLVNGGIHNFDNKPINANYYVGGLVGSNSGNTEISFSQNKGSITGVGSTNTNYIVTETVNTYTGGIIGEVNNLNKDTSSLIYLSNYGDIDANEFIGKTEKANQFVGGVFGSVKGYGFKLNLDDEIYNGGLENSGLIKGKYINSNTYLYAAGIGIANTNENLAKISYMSNHNGYQFTNFNYQNHNKNIYYAATIVDNSSSGIELSRAYNYQEYEFGKQYFSKISGLSDPSEIKISPFFTSTKDNGSKMVYVENKGRLLVGSETEDVDVETTLKVSNITQATKVDYYNVINSGDINVLRINNKADLYVAGITWILPYILRAYIMKDVVNEGNIITAGILGNTVISSHSGTNYTETNYSGTFSTIHNLYVAGLVNLNVGEITNIFNLGKISSKYDENIYDIKGTANSFIGGIVTFNYNLVQDAANSGNIIYTNSNTSARSYYAGVVNNGSYNTRLGGITIVYEGGLTIGGIAAAIGNIAATVLNGYKEGFINGTEPDNTTMPRPLKYAQILDTINSGDIFGKAKEFVRSGGVLGLALSAELASGTYESRNTNVTDGPFGRGILGAADPIGKSLLSNGLNYGNIYAITSTIGNLNGSIGTGSASNSANFLRPGINASAGGVVAYGLTTMIRMINHGTIASTDTAGGIIGATYILGNTTTEVDINTAVHYGKVKVARRENFNLIEYDENETFEAGQKYHGDNNEIMFPDHGYDLARYHNNKRGFGGLIGRLQRGYYGYMVATNFINIMNMDPYVDLIGRTDMHSATASRSYFQLHRGDQDITYYSARENDTTGYVAVGWYKSLVRSFSFNNARVKFTVNYSNRIYYITRIEVETPDTSFEIHDLTKRVVNVGGSSEDRTVTRKVKLNGLIYSGDNTSSQYRIANFGLTAGRGSSYDVNRNLPFPQEVIKENYTHRTGTISSISSGSNTTPPSDSRLQGAVEYIVDDAQSNIGNYIFDPDFPLMATENSEYIYAANEDALATRFKQNGPNEKPNGMYVLASTTGSLDGATLPSNIRINNLFRLNESTFRYIDLENVGIEDKELYDSYANKIESNYEEMYQLSFNNKAEILPEDQSAETKIAELTLYDPYGNSPILTRGVVDYDSKTITYRISNSAFSQNSIYYEVKENLLSNNAIIAKSNISESELIDFRNNYLEAKNNVLDRSSEFKFSYSGTISSGQTISFPIKVYSELSIMDQNIFENGKYTETYTVILIRENTNIETNATITLNKDRVGSNTFDVSNISGNYSIKENLKLYPDGNIQVLFRGRTSQIRGLIPLNHLMSIHNIYLVENQEDILIDPNYYNVTIIPRDSNYRFGFVVEFSDLLSNGQYKIEYSYYDNSARRYINVHKDTSDSFDIVDVKYNYFSNDLEGLINYFTRTSEQEFMTYIEFGYQIPGVDKQVKNLDLIVHNKTAPSYVDYKYYELHLEENKIIELEIAPFAELISATIMYEYTEQGKVRYVLKYTIVNESNDEQIITHYILERDTREMLIFLDDNLQTSNSFTITREARLSKISIDFNFINDDLYQNVIFSVHNINGELPFTDDEIYEGIHENMFVFYITGLLDKGENTYLFKIERELGIYYDLGEIIIEKLPGQSAYLLDIKFTVDDNEIVFEYPVIRATNEDGVIDNSYDPRIYADGIDYETTIINNIKHFRIDGKVSDIILEHYSPRFFLPYGATIERYDSLNQEWVTDLYDDFAGSEDDVEKVVKYRVISEDESQEVIYFITARDIKYNLTLRFKVFYELPNGTIVDASDINSPVRNSFILISLKNLKLDGVYLTTGPKVSDFPKGISEENILGINNQSSLFYFTANNSSIIYRFGRNSTGAYNFNIIPPIYSGVKTDSLTPGERYRYEMYMMPIGVSDWKTNDYKLPTMHSIAEGYSGLYYHVSSTSPYPITRELAIVIKSETTDQKWGLYDEYTSWD